MARKQSTAAMQCAEIERRRRALVDSPKYQEWILEWQDRYRRAVMKQYLDPCTKGSCPAVDFIMED